MQGLSLPERPDCAAPRSKGAEALQGPLWPTFLATEKSGSQAQRLWWEKQSE